MKKVFLVFFLLVLAGASALAWTFRAETLSVPGAWEGEAPDPSPPPEMSVAVAFTGHMLNVAALAYRGGSFADERVFGMDVVVVDHPNGLLLFDAGFGRDAKAHFRKTPWLMQATSEIAPAAPLVDQLAAAGIEPNEIAGIVLTHTHWDHVSGLFDFPGVPVWINEVERAYGRSAHPGAALANDLEEAAWRVYDFPDGPYLGFTSSWDVFEDGSVVLVPAAGHTPGSIIAFVHLPNGESLAIIGDTAWQEEGVALPAERPWLTRRMVDVDPTAVRALLIHLHRLKSTIPGLRILPAHDRRAMKTLPSLSKGAGT